MSRGQVAHGQEVTLPASCVVLQAKAVLALAIIMEEVSRSRAHEEKWAGPAPSHASRYATSALKAAVVLCIII